MVEAGQKGGVHQFIVLNEVISTHTHIYTNTNTHTHNQDVDRVMLLAALAKR
jgi:hypothetical protein